MPKYDLSLSLSCSHGNLLDQDSAVRALRGFTPVPVSVSRLDAKFRIEAGSDFAAQVLATEVFDDLKKHLEGKNIDVESWRLALEK